MKPKTQIRNRSNELWLGVGVSCAFLVALGVTATAQTTAKTASSNSDTSPTGPEAFTTPQQAADALIKAAETFDVGVLERIFGADGEDIVVTGEPARDRARAETFAAEAREKTVVSVDPKNVNRQEEQPVGF